jgi:hypothetical protein
MFGLQEFDNVQVVRTKDSVHRSTFALSKDNKRLLINVAPPEVEAEEKIEEMIVATVDDDLRGLLGANLTVDGVDFKLAGFRKKQKLGRAIFGLLKSCSNETSQLISEKDLFNGLLEGKIPCTVSSAEAQDQVIAFLDSRTEMKRTAKRKREEKINPNPNPTTFSLAL